MNNPALTKTCSSCGQLKPLAAFLEMGGPEGAMYGSICSTCRKANREKPIVEKEHDESTTSHTGFKIDAKAKVQADTDKRELFERSEEEYYEERDKEFEHEKTHIKKTQQHASEEKKHRESFLDRRSYPETNKKNLATGNSPSEIARREENPDFTNPFVDTQIAGKMSKEYSSIYQQFKNWLPKSSALNQNSKQAQQKIVQDKSQKQTADNQKAERSSKDYIKKTWGPGSRGG